MSHKKIRKPGKHPKQKCENLYNDELGMNEKEIMMERAHRLPSRRKVGRQPIIVKFSHYKDREAVLKTFRRKRKEKREQEGNQSGTHETEEVNDETLNISVAEDYTDHVRQIRRKLQPLIKTNIQANKKVFLKYDKIVIENETFMMKIEKIYNINNRKAMAQRINMQV